MYREGNPFNFGRYRLKHTQDNLSVRQPCSLGGGRRGQKSDSPACTLPDVVPAGVRAAAEADRAVAVEELLEESAAGQPHPAARVHAEVRIQQQLVKYLDGEGPNQPPGDPCHRSSQVARAPQGARAFCQGQATESFERVSGTQGSRPIPGPVGAGRPCWARAGRTGQLLLREHSPGPRSPS